MTTCVVCQARTDAALCWACTRKLEKAIAELPALLHELDVTIARQDRGTSQALYAVNRRRVQIAGQDYDEGQTTLPATPWPLSWDASNLRWSAVNTIQTWARHIAESHGLDGSSSPGELLLAAINEIRADEAAEQLYDEIMSLEPAILAAIDRRMPDQFAGRCDATQVSFDLAADGSLVPVAAICGADLYGHDGDPTVKCHACGMKYPLAERLAEMKDRQINDQLATAHNIANALTTIDNPLRPDMLRKWIERDAKAEPSPAGPACTVCNHGTCRLIRRPLIIAQGCDDEGHWLYRVGDVRARVKIVEEQRGARLSA